MKKQNLEPEIVNEATSETLKNEPFEPKKIGVCNKQSASELDRRYKIIIDHFLLKLQSELAESIGTEITKEELVAYLAAPDWKKWIQTKYIEVNNLQHGGMDVYRMFDLNLIPGPETEEAAWIAKQISNYERKYEQYIHIERYTHM